MSYNKTDALREKGAAEKLVVSNDYMGAREKLREAQRLFPALDHIVPMLTVSDILSASKTIIPGYDTDYYWILHLMPSATISDISYQHQKLVSLLQPIKSKFPGTDLALKLLQETFSVLSDKKKRVAFDAKRGTCWVDFESSALETPLMHTRNPYLDLESAENLGPTLLANSNSDKACFSVGIQESGSSSDAVYKRNKIQDIDMQTDGLNSEPDHCSSVGIVQKMPDRDFYNFDNNRTVECLKEGQIWAVYPHLNEPHTSKYAQISTTSEFSVTFAWLVPIPVSVGERRWHDAGLPVACGTFFLDSETSGTVNYSIIFSYKCSWVRGVTEEQFEIYPQKGEGMLELDQLALQNNVIHIEDASDHFSFDIRKEEIYSLKPNLEITVLGPNWSATDFTAGHVWAAYSGQDLMPRHYSLINNVISKNQVRVIFLEPEPILDHEVYWKKESLPIVCGIFRAKEISLNLEMSQFSHQVICEKRATTPIYKIYPLKDISDGETTMVARLGDVKGCLTFFQRQQCKDGFDLVRAIPKNEVMCFSHQVPAFRVPGIGRYGIPESCWHLEPVALSPHLG